MVETVVWTFDLLFLLMVLSFLITAAILIFNRLWSRFYNTIYKRYNGLVIRHLVDESEEIPPPSVLEKSVFRDVLIDLLFITKGPTVHALRAVYEKSGLFAEDVAALKNRAWHRRLASLVRLDRWKNDLPFEEIVPLMEDENKFVAQHAFRTLCLSPDDAIARKVLNCLLKMNIHHSTIYECLYRLIQNHRALILSLIENPAWNELSEDIVKVIGERRDIAAVPALIHVSQVGTSAMKKNAFTALGRIGDPRGLSVLLEGLQSDDAKERLAALKAVHALDEDRLRELKELSSDPDPLVRGWTSHFLKEARR